MLPPQKCSKCCQVESLVKRGRSYSVVLKTLIGEDIVPLVRLHSSPQAAPPLGVVPLTPLRGGGLTCTPLASELAACAGELGAGVCGWILPCEAGDFEGSAIAPVEQSPREGHEAYGRMASGPAEPVEGRASVDRIGLQRIRHHFPEPLGLVPQPRRDAIRA